MTFGEASTIEAEDSAPCPIGRPSSLDECEELLEYYEGLYEHGLEFIETARPFSVEKLKAKGIGASHVPAPRCLLLLCVRAFTHIAGAADFEKGDPSPLLAPPDATTWVGAISITREARVCIRFLEKVKKDMEAEEAGRISTVHSTQICAHRSWASLILQTFVSPTRAGAAAGQEEQASQASPHKEPILRSMLAAIRAASVRTVQRLCAIYGAFMENAWRIWASTRSTEKATTGAGALLSVQHQPKIFGSPLGHDQPLSMCH